MIRKHWNEEIFYKEIEVPQIKWVYIENDTVISDDAE